MIAYIKGTVHAYGMDYVILENNGIGFRINYMHPETLSLNKEMTIYTYQHVREDEISLFGFVSEEEYDIFMQLINVKGIGPKSASNVLAVINPAKLVSIIEDNDVAALKKLPGIGAKAASQIILDLKGKLVAKEVETKAAHSPELEDALAALKSLGYKPAEVNAVVKELENQKLKTAEDYIRVGLSLLMKRKGA